MEFAPGILRAGFTSAPFMFSFGLLPPHDYPFFMSLSEPGIFFCVFFLRLFMDTYISKNGSRNILRVKLL